MISQKKRPISTSLILNEFFVFFREPEKTVLATNMISYKLKFGLVWK